MYDKIQNKNWLTTPDDQADFLATQGVDKQKFMHADKSYAVMPLMEQGDKLTGHQRRDPMGEAETGFRGGVRGINR